MSKPMLAVDLERYPVVIAVSLEMYW